MGIVEKAFDSFDTLPNGSDITHCLEVIKWEPEPVQCHNANLLPISITGLSKYDIEGADRYPDIVELLMDQPVQVTEKLEGMNYSVSCSISGEIFVNQREYTIKPKEGAVHSFWKIAEEQGLISQVELIHAATLDSVALYGEYLGPGSQGNHYKLKANEVQLFDIKIGSNFVDPAHTSRFTGGLGNYVPTLAQGITLREWLDGRTIQEASNGQSVLNPDRMREGVVVKPMMEQRHPAIGRLMIKQRSPQYLAKYDT